MNFNELRLTIEKAHNSLIRQAYVRINYNYTVRNWLIGCYIIEFEQNGEDRAEYGNLTLSNLAKEMTHIKGLSLTNLKLFRKFYLTYPSIGQILSGQLKEFGLLAIGQTVPDQLEAAVLNIGQTMPDQLEAAVLNIGQTMPDQLKAAVLNIGQTMSDQLKEGELGIGQTVSDRSSKSDEKPIPGLSAKKLLTSLSFSHFIELLRVDDDLKRRFYEVEAINNAWNVRDLARAIDTLLFERTGLSNNKHAVIEKIKNNVAVPMFELIKNPYLLEFLGLQDKSEYSELDLEKALINNLQTFLTELGKGFCFEARQKRITFDNTHYRIDLVFYHRILKCHILVDLKLGKFDHADAGQMNLYLNYYKKNEMSEGDNPPVGIILCTDKNDTLVEYTTTGLAHDVFVSKYLVELPSKETLEAFIKNELNDEI